MADSFYEPSPLYSTTNSSATNNLQCSAFNHWPAMYNFLWWGMPALTFVATMANLLIIAAMVKGRAHLLLQAHHIHVLSICTLNVVISQCCTLPLWIDTLALACAYLGPAFARYYSAVSLTTTYECLFIVCLLCRSRYRIVKLGTLYNEHQECRAAPRMLACTVVLSIALYVLHEFVLPSWQRRHGATADASESSSIADGMHRMIGSEHLSNSVIVLSLWCIIVLLSFLCIRHLIHLKKNKTSSFYKTVRSSLVMFGSVLGLLLTFGPHAAEYWVRVVFSKPQVDDTLFWLLVYLQSVYPLVDPIVFVSTLPKLRAQLLQMLRSLRRKILWTKPTNRVMPVDQIVGTVNQTHGNIGRTRVIQRSLA